MTLFKRIALLVQSAFLNLTADSANRAMSSAVAQFAKTEAVLTKAIEACDARTKRESEYRDHVWALWEESLNRTVNAEGDRVRARRVREKIRELMR